MTNVVDTRIPVFVGIDVSKPTFNYHIRPLSQAGVLANSPDGIRQFLERVLVFNVQCVILEATGGYEKIIAAELAAAKLPVAIVNPRQVRDFAKASGRLAKNDAIDASVIAHFAEAIRPQIRSVPDADSEFFSELVARRRQLIEIRTAESNRLQIARGPKVKSSIQLILSSLAQQIERIEKDIDDTISSSPIWKEKDDLLQSVPSIGPITARSLLADIPELGQLNRRQAGSIAGLAPFDHDSGKLRGVRCISGGRAPVRTALYMATLSAIRRNPVIRAFYQKLRLKGKAFKVAMVACMRKLLCILNMVLKTKIPWRELTPQNT